MDFLHFMQKNVYNQVWILEEEEHYGRIDLEVKRLRWS